VIYIAHNIECNCILFEFTNMEYNYISIDTWLYSYNYIANNIECNGILFEFLPAWNTNIFQSLHTGFYFDATGFYLNCYHHEIQIYFNCYVRDFIWMQRDFIWIVISMKYKYISIVTYGILFGCNGILFELLPAWNTNIFQSTIVTYNYITNNIKCNWM